MKKAKAKFLAGWVLIAFALSLVIPLGASFSTLQVDFLSPADKAFLSENKTLVKGLVCARGGAVKVDFLVNGTLFQSTEVVPSQGRGEFSFPWDTGDLAPGRYGLTLVAKGNTGEQASARITVKVAGQGGIIEPPRIESPAEGSVVSGKVQVRIRTDEKEKSNVVLLVDGRLAWITNLPPYCFEWDASRLAEGRHILQAQVYRPDGQVVSSEKVSVQVAGFILSGVARSSDRHGGPEGLAAEGSAKVTSGVPEPQKEAPLTSKATSIAKASTAPPGGELLLPSGVQSPRQSEQAVSIVSLQANVSGADSPGLPKAKTEISARARAWEMSLTLGPGNQAPERPSRQETRGPGEPETSSARTQYSLLPDSGGQGRIELSRPSPKQEGPAISVLPAEEPVSRKPNSSAGSAPEPLLEEAGISPQKQQETQPQGTFCYTVQKGDSLWSIARHYGSSVAAIAEANGLEEAARIRAGQRLIVPTGPALYLEGKALAASPGAFFSNGRLMVPLRAIVEACGGNVHWEAKTRQITVIAAGAKIVLRVGEAQALVNGQLAMMTAATRLHAGRAFISMESLCKIASLPVRYEPLGNRVEVARLPG